MLKTKKIELGYSDFKEFINSGNYFVDKTMLIYDLFSQGAYISLMPRPKRFGKTLNLSMVEHFFDIQKPDSKKLFTDFEISQKKDFCEKHQNKYPVINITLKDIDETNWDNCFESFKSLISKLYRKYNFLLKSKKLDNFDKKNINAIISEAAPLTKYKESLENLSIYLKKHFNKKVIILVDEYDAPIINAFQHTAKPIKSKKGNTTYYEKLINFMQTFLGKVYKGNDTNLQKGLLTGVMRVGRESIFSKWNNFKVFGITSSYFSSYFGFTQQETNKILAYFNLQDRTNNIKKWYDGYKFGNTDRIYNPWSIVNYVKYENDGYRPHWVNSSDDSLIKDRIAVENIKNAVIELINGKTIIRTIKENFVFSDFEHNTELIWTLLFYSGFITPVKQVSLYRYEFRIPNYELKFVFKNLILEWLENRYKFTEDLLIKTSHSLINNNIEEFEIGFKQILGDTLSYFDTASNKQGEQFFHVYTLGLLTILSDDYIISSNRESGEGRYDIVLIPRNSNNISLNASNGIIIEIKQIENQQEDESNSDFIDRINSKIDEALEQIERKKYYKKLLTHQVNLEKIKSVPIVFVGKEPYITKLPIE